MDDDFECEFFDRNTHELVGRFWVWVAVRNGVAVAALTAERIGPDADGSARARVGMVYSEVQGGGRYLVQRAIDYLRDEHKLVLYRTGRATSKGAALFENFDVTIDPTSIRKHTDVPRKSHELAEKGPRRIRNDWSPR